MAAYLIVAHQTAASPELVSKLREISASDPEAEFVLLVPATPPAHLLTWVEGAREEIARRRASEATTELRRAGFNIVESLVGPPDPLQAVRDEHDRARRSYALTIISTLPPGVSRWLRRDLANQVRRQLGLPIAHVVSSADTENLPPQEAARAAGGTATSQQPAGGSRWSLPELARWRGSRLSSPNGNVGVLREIVYDYASLEPVWLGVESHPLPFRILLVPVAMVEVTGGALRTPLSMEKIQGQPDVSIGEGIASLTDEERLFHYFGIPYELRDVRVLRAGQPLPGSTQSQQSIFEPEAAPPAGSPSR